jgi:hypothetical protein
LLKSFPRSAGDYSGAIIDAQYANVETVKCKQQIDANSSLHHASCVCNRNIFRALRAAAFDFATNTYVRNCIVSAGMLSRLSGTLSRKQCRGMRMAADANMHSRAVYA